LWGQSPAGLFGDVREADGGQVAPQAFDGLLGIGVAGVGVVEAHHLQALVAQRDDGMGVVQHLGARTPQRLAHGGGARPVVVVAQHTHHGSPKAPDHFFELVEVLLAVAHEVARDDHQVRLLRIGQCHGRFLHAVRGHPAEVLIGEVGDPEV
jgi:hypothetical protein